MPQKAVNKILNSSFGLQLASLTFLYLFIMSFRPLAIWPGQTFESIVFNHSDSFIIINEPGFLENTIGVNTAGMERITIEDEDGNMIERIIPKKREKEISYIVKAGDHVTSIAHRFGLKVSTILWANKISAKTSIKPGQKLRIPPSDGVYYILKKGETLSEIAKIHGIELARVQAYNHLGSKVKVGQEIFLPEAKKIYVQAKPMVVPSTKTTSKKGSGNKYTSTYPKTYTNGGGVKSMGMRLLKPTQGVLTQGFHKGHYALDIASVLNTPIYAAAAGTVVREAHSGWNYGYGRYIVIDHGNGVETLYAHNNITKVSVGDTVKKGQLIALMGNTGNVRGRTGIHVHFEVRINGRKVNPYNYFQ